MAGRPRPGTTLIGRDAELALARRLLASDARLVTFVGPPGVGKTRVLRQLARELVLEGSDVRLVFLRDVAPPGVLAATLRALGGGSRTATRATAIARVAERMEVHATVLVFDEAEHVCEEVAELVTAWLEGTTRARILVSSRERLDVPFEHVVRIEPLATDAAVMLLHDALERAACRWKVTDDEARRLVARVDGLPLGVELLASRVASLGAASVLASSAKTLALPPLDEVLEDSFTMLGDDARLALEALSVFKETFTLEAAAAIVGADADATAGVKELVDASLLRPTDGPGGLPRFEMLTVIRSFAAKKLAARGRSDEIALRHVTTFARLAERAHERARERAGEDLDVERANLLAAFDAANAVGEVRAAQRLALALDGVLVRQGPPDLHRDVMLAAIELSATSGGDHGVLAELHRAYGRFLALRGRFREALAAGMRASALAEEIGDRRVAAWSASFECFVRRALGELETAERAGRAALAYAHEASDLRLEALAEQALGLVDHARGAHEAASQRYLRAIAAAQRCGDDRTRGIALANRALTLLAMGHHAAADEHWRDAHACFESSGDRYHLARIRPLEVALARAAGELEAAESRFAASVDAVRDQGDLVCEAELLLEGARVASLRRARAQAEARLAEALLVARHLEDVFVAAEVEAVTGEVQRAERGELTLKIDMSGRAIELTGGVAGRVTIDLSRRAALRRILIALADQHGRSPRGLALAEVLEAGWPGERMRAESASARVYMAIRRLRALGLEEVLLTTDDGYALSSLVRIVR